MFGVAVLALGLQVEALLFLACVLGVWWFENWIVDASKNSETIFLVLLVFTFINFNRLHFGGVA